MPKGIRPTQDKVRKALFDILGDIEGLSFLELFAGSGAVGFEAISRGIGGLTLVEQKRECLLAIKDNIESLALDEGICRLYPIDAQRAIVAMHKEKRKFDIVFFDPPYYKDLSPRHCTLGKIAGGSGSREKAVESLSKKTLQMLGAYDILAPNGFIVIQHFKKEELPQDNAGFSLIKEASYGDTILSFYRKVNPKSQ